MISQIKAGVILSYLQMGLTIVLRLFYTPLLLRHLGISGYGIYSLALSVIGYLTVLDFGFNNAVIRYTTRLQVKNEEHITEQELLGLFWLFYVMIAFVVLIVGGVFLLFAGSIYGNKLTGIGLSIFRVVVSILAVNLAFSFPLSIYKSIISSYERFIFLRVTTILYEIINVGVMLLILLLNGYVIALTIGVTVINLLLRLCEFTYCKVVLHTKIKINLKFAYLYKEIVCYSIFVFLGSIGNQMYKNGSQMLLGATSGTDSVALYALALQIETFFISISLTFTSVFLPKLTKISACDNDREISEIFLKVGRIQYIILQWFFYGIVLLGKPFIRIWGGEEYGDTYYITVLLLLPLLITKSQNIGKIILQAKNKMRLPYVVSFLVAPVLSLFVAYPVSKYYGAIGCAVVCACGMALAEIVFMDIYYQVCHNIDVVRWWINAIKLSVAPAVVAVCFFFLFQKYVFDGYFKIFVGGFVFSVAYFCLMAFFLDEYERSQIKHIYSFIRTKVSMAGAK